MNRNALASAVGLAALLSSCAVTPSARPTATASPTTPPTSTVAFPTLVPSPTWTAVASATPTPDPGVVLGSLLLHDTFDDPTAWRLATTSIAGAAIADGRLTLAVHAPRGYHSAQRLETEAGDFFAEVDVFTVVCNPGDEYGLTARGDRLGQQYRFLLGCDGTVRMARVLEEGSRALTLRLETTALRPGAPAHNHLAVWARGLDLKMYVNGVEVLTARDAALDRGGFGLLIRAGSGGQLTVSFDDLIVHALAQATPSATTTAVP